MVNKMEIYIIEQDKDKFKYLNIYFSDLENVSLINQDIKKFLKDNTNIECVVSPANSFGIMDGGFDLALTEYYGTQLQERVQKYIIDNYFGEQPVGTSFIIETNKDNQYLIHTPTMRLPNKIKDKQVIYQAMRTTLIEAKKNNIKSIVIPMFGGSTGICHPNEIAKLMRLAYDQINDVPNNMDWDYAYKREIDE